MTAFPPFEAEIWLWQGKGAWHFLTVPEDLSDLLRAEAFAAPRAWGSVRVAVRAGDVRWDTSVFWDSRGRRYILPLKAEVRRRLGVAAGDRLRVTLSA